MMHEYLDAIRVSGIQEEFRKSLVILRDGAQVRGKGDFEGWRWRVSVDRGTANTKR